MGSAGVPLLLLVGVLSWTPGSEAGKEPPHAHFLYQEKADCHFFNGTQRVHYLDKYFCGRQEIVRFDSDLGKFVALAPLGQPDAEDWNSDKNYLQYSRAGVDRCRHDYGVLQDNQVVGRRTPEMACLAFYDKKSISKSLKKGTSKETEYQVTTNASNVHQTLNPLLA